MNFNYLKKYKSIIVIGHKKPDADTILSSKILSEIFKSMGIHSSYGILDGEKMNQFENNITAACLTYNPFIVKTDDIKNHFYFLVDHNDVSQSVEDIGLVVGSIDHHPDSGYVKNPILGKYCSTALFIYDLFKKEYEFSDEQKKQIYYASLSDSLFTKSSRYKEKDSILLKELGFNDDADALFKKFFIPTNLENKEIAFKETGRKIFKIKDIIFESTTIDVFDNDNLEAYKNFVSTMNNFFIGRYCNLTTGITYAFLKYNNEVIEFKYDHVTSRIDISKDVLDYIEREEK
jgi:inorganic pyrophosphatase/exopolyphosphatase